SDHGSCAKAVHRAMIVVFGSINLDLVTPVVRLPLSGETVLGQAYAVHPGGKGANQALAARRAGAEVFMVGAVGDDSFAAPALSLLREGGVDLARVAQMQAPTGAAFITVDAEGANQIVVASGANVQVRAAMLNGLTFASRDILLLQREVPEVECIAAARIAGEKGARVVLNLAPSGPIDPALLALLDMLVVNEHEALDLAQSLGWSETDPDAIAARIDAEHNVACIATLGAEGAVGWSGGVRRAVPAPPTQVVDTTAAGDAFVGALAAALAAGFGFMGALERAVAAGSLACTKPGAQPSLPHKAEIDALAATLA
ncbi:MAG: ribokinase, partial [Bosea sp. (in: a-proteobacteria)]